MNGTGRANLYGNCEKGILMSSRKKTAKREALRRKKQQRRAAKRKPKGLIRRSVPPDDGMFVFDEAEEKLLFDMLASFENGGVAKGATKTRRVADDPLEAEADAWWDKFSDADGPESMRMIQEQLELLSQDDPRFERYFPESIHELECKLSVNEYVAVLEELMLDQPEVMKLAPDWFTYPMLFAYLKEERWEQVDTAVHWLAENMKAIDVVLFSIVPALRLAGREENVQRLIEAALPLISKTDLLPWAIDEVIDQVAFFPLQECVAEGATPDAIAKWYQKCSETVKKAMGVNIKREWFARSAQSLAGQFEGRFRRKELLSSGKEAVRKIVSLIRDYQRWLTVECGVEPIAAYQLQCLVFEIVMESEGKRVWFLDGLVRSKFEIWRLSKIGLLPMDGLQVPAGIIALDRLYEYLYQQELVPSKVHEKAREICRGYWQTVEDFTGLDLTNGFRFLSRYASPDLLGK